MKINLRTKFKSLNPFESEDLTDLVIITGKNGSGKTQLLNCLSSWVKSRPDNKVVFPDNEINSIQSEGVIKDRASVIGFNEWRLIIQGQWQIFQQFEANAIELLEFIVVNDLVEDAAKTDRTSLISESEVYKKIISDTVSKMRLVRRTPDYLIQSESEIFMSLFRNNDMKTFYDIIKELCDYNNKEVAQLVEADFYKTPISESNIDDRGLFSSQIEMIFFNYAKRRHSNRLAWFYKKEEGQENNSVSDKEFVSLHVPPWVTVNNIMSINGIQYHFKEIPKGGYDDSVTFDFQLHKNDTDEVIPFQDLSSGERVIVGLVLKLFTSEYYQDTLNFPDIIVLDEPDAHLHPEMSKLLLDVLEKVFVKKHGIRVIMTTHSPSTVALAPESCIYELRNGSESSLKNISKDDALKMLTGFIPTLSIDYKNHKQVFVESPTDVFYYQSIYNKHVQSQGLKPILYFISNAQGKGNCSSVYSIVSDIRESGNTTSFGIVDWDLDNKSDANIFVHGSEERYSIENYLLDPVYLIVLLMDMDNAHNICSLIGVEESYNQYLIGEDERLQQFADAFFECFKDVFPAENYEEKVEVKYHNGKVINVPKWYLLKQGHSLVDLVKEVFKALEKYNEVQLQKKLTKMSLKCYPFVAQSTVDVFETILKK